jgi:hypothetical protein
MRALAASGDERTSLRVGDQRFIDRAREQWYLVEREIPWLEWVSITDRLSGVVIWRNSLEQQKSGTMRVNSLWLPEERFDQQQVMSKIQGADGWAPTRIEADDGPGAALQIGGPGVPDIILDGRGIEHGYAQDEWDALSDEQKRAYWLRTAPSVNVMHDLLANPDEDLEHGYPGERFLGLPKPQPGEQYLGLPKDER